MKLKLTEAAKKLGIHKQTLWGYIKIGKIPATKTPTNRWYVDTTDIDKFIGESTFIQEQGVALYARISSSENKEDLERQVNRLVGFANARGWRVVRIEKEIASGVNDQRPKLLGLLKEYHKYDYIIVEHKDRLTRFGFNLIINNINNIYVINEMDNEEHGLMEDLVSIITSFCARLYGQRRSKRKTERLIEELRSEEI
jgi:predicted site-specific integrase-resolvase